MDTVSCQGKKEVLLLQWQEELFDLILQQLHPQEVRTVQKQQDMQIGTATAATSSKRGAVWIGTASTAAAATSSARGSVRIGTASSSVRRAVRIGTASTAAVATSSTKGAVRNGTVGAAAAYS